MTERETLQELIGLAYDLQEEVFIDFTDKTTEKYDRENTLGCMEDYEVKDMDKYLEEYPFLKAISYGVLYSLQKYYNSEWLCAGWCGCCPPDRLVILLEQAKESIDEV
ncbi:MAG: hypothetical protein J6T74_00545 [Clostridia bacterium]|nr:hypothetical protein [Clostridia bacterium]MBO7712061.1 hypothetical protein [Methanobrevibacter sp.]MBO7712134.1 hypothetical protein [Methanobrevibacter sp.]